MNKLLRISMMAILALVSNFSFAETKIWSEDWTGAEGGQTPTQVNANYTSELEGTKIYTESLAGGVAPELLVAKKGGSFTAVVALNGASGDMTLRFKTNKTLAVSSSTAGVKVGDIVASGNTKDATISVPAGTASISITFSNSSTSNARLDDIVLFQGEAKKPAGLSWGTASRTATIGSEDNLFPTLTNANELAVKYTSTKEDVATISAEGVVTLVGAGETVISAIFDGNDTYEAQTVSYTLTVKAAPTVDISNTPETAYSVAKAQELITAGEGLDTKVYVKGKVSEINEVSTQYGNATYYISDDGTKTNQLSVYRGYYLGGEKFTADDQLKVGDVVVLYGKLQLYKETTPQITTGSQIYSLNGTVAGISNIKVNNANGIVYNLAGQRVANSFKGIVVKNGKKYINRK